MLIVSNKPFMLSECRYAECRYTECRYAECHRAEVTYNDKHSSLLRFGNNYTRYIFYITGLGVSYKRH